MKHPTRDLLMMSRPFVFYIPLTVAGLLWAAPSALAGRPAALLWVPAGLVFWTLLEWTLHRGMHLRTPWPRVTAFQDRAHLRHHRVPEDLPHSVVGLGGSIPLAAAVFGGAWLVLGNLPDAVLFICGVFLGYLFYETVHLAGHAGANVPVIASLSRYHMRHHYGSPRRAFGVTSPLWDWVFGSLPAQPAPAVVADHAAEPAQDPKGP